MPWVPNGPHIRAKREERALTIVELAEKVGISESSIRRIEGGLTKSIRPATLRLLAEALGCGIQEIATQVNWATAIRAAGQNGQSGNTGAPAASADEIPQGVSRSAPFMARGKRGRPLGSSHSKEPPLLTTEALHDLGMVFRTYEGRFYRMEGCITAQAALSDGERVALGCGRGIGARFLVALVIAPGETLDVTIFASTAPETRRLQALFRGTPPQSSTTLVKILVVNSVAEHPTLTDDLGPRVSLAQHQWFGFSRFGTDGVAPWTFVAVKPGSVERPLVPYRR